MTKRLMLALALAAALTGCSGGEEPDPPKAEEWVGICVGDSTAVKFLDDRKVTEDLIDRPYERIDNDLCANLTPGAFQMFYPEGEAYPEVGEKVDLYGPAVVDLPPGAVVR